MQVCMYACVYVFVFSVLKVCVYVWCRRGGIEGCEGAAAGFHSAIPEHVGRSPRTPTGVMMESYIHTYIHTYIHYSNINILL
jgi:hypothetical protein